MEEQPIVVRLRSEALGQSAFISLLTKAELSIRNDTIDLEYYEDSSLKVLSIAKGQIDRIEPQLNRITRAQQLMAIARFGLFLGALAAVLMWIAILVKGQIAVSVLASIGLTVVLVVLVGAIITVYNLPKIAWSPLTVLKLTYGDGKSLDVYIGAERARELMARLNVPTHKATVYSKVIVVGEASDTPLMRQAEGMLVRSLVTTPNHPLASDVEVVTEGVAELPPDERAKVEPFVWVIQARHGKRGGAWLADFHDAMGFPFMVVYLE